VAGPDIDTPEPIDELAVAPTEPRDSDSILDLVADWLALSYALNAMSRSLGNNDLYPFVLAPAVVDKLRFVHEMVGAGVPPEATGPVAAETATGEVPVVTPGAPPAPAPA
jgi:hypothetical protein